MAKISLPILLFFLLFVFSFFFSSRFISFSSTQTKDTSLSQPIITNQDPPNISDTLSPQRKFCQQFEPLFKQINVDFQLVEQNRPKSLLGKIEPWNLEEASRSSICASYCLRLKIKNNKLEVVFDRKGYETRNPSVIKIINDTVERFEIPDVEFLVITEDRIYSDSNFPYFLFSRIPKQFGILYPDFTFNHWKETRIDEWETMQKQLQDSRNNKPFEKRIPQAFWRGALTNIHREELIKLSNQYPDQIDAKFMEWYNPTTPHVSIPDHCKYKYLVHTEGRSYSARLKYLMSCGSVVFYPEVTFIEYWYHLIQPWIHVVPVEPNFSDLIEKMKQIEKNPSLESEIRRNSYELIEKYLTIDGVHCYWAELLHRFSQLEIITGE